MQFSQSGAWEARYTVPEFIKPQQAILKCIANVHCIKEAAEAQNFRKAELQSSRLEDKLTQQTKQPQHLRRLGKRHMG